MEKMGLNTVFQQANNAGPSYRDTLKSYNFLYIGFFVTTAIILLAGGWLVGNQRAASMDTQMRKRLIEQAVIIAHAIDPKLARKITFTAADTNSPAFGRIREEIGGIGRMVPDAASIYLMAKQNDRIVFGANVDFKNTENAPPVESGTPYEEASVELKRIFETKQPFTEGPLTDTWGTFVSSLAPILDPASGKVMMVVGIDILANDWQSRLNTARHESLVAAIALILLVLGVDSITRYRRQVHSEKKRAMRALRDSEAYVRTVLESTSTGFVVIDATSHQIIDTNRAAAELFGTERNAYRLGMP